MKSKIIPLILAVLVVSTSFAGCREATDIRVPDQSIPFLTLVPDKTGSENIKKAILNFWNLKNGKITKTDQIMYTVTPTTDIKSEQSMYEGYNGDSPLYWDGENCIIVPSFFKSVTNLYRRTETIAKVPGSEVIFGKDVEMITIPTPNVKDYRCTVKLWDGANHIEKELYLKYGDFPYKSSSFFYPVAIANNDTNLNILFSGDYNPKMGIELFLCTVDKDTWASKWSRVTFEGGASASPSNPPLCCNSIYFDGSFYVPSCCRNIAQIDMQDHICRKWETGYRYILGSFKDMIIVGSGACCGEEGSSEGYYMHALRNGEQIGMLRLTNGNTNVDVMDKDGNILSNAILDENTSIIFPKMTGGM